MNNNKILKTMIPVLGFMLFFVQGDSVAVSPMLISIARDFNITISQAGLNAVAYMIPFGLFTIIFGPLGDKYGKIGMIRIAAFGTAIFSILGGFAPDLYILILCRMVNGIFAAALMPVSMALIGEVTGNNREQLQKTLSKTMALMFFGGAIAPVIGGAISYFGSWRLVYIIYGAFEILLSIIIVVKIKIESNADKSITIISSYKETFANKTLIKTVSIMGILGAAVLGCYTYMGKYIELKSGFTVFQVGLILGFYGIGTLIGGRCAPKLKPKLKGNYFIFASVIGAVSLLLLALIPNIYVITISLFGFGFSFTLIQPMLLAHAQSSFPQKRGTVMSLASFNMCLGGGIGTLLYGLLLQQFNFRYIFIIGSILFIFIAVFATKIVVLRKENLSPQ